MSIMVSRKQFFKAGTALAGLLILGAAWNGPAVAQVMHAPAETANPWTPYARPVADPAAARPDAATAASASTPSPQPAGSIVPVDPTVAADASAEPAPMPKESEWVDTTAQPGPGAPADTAPTVSTAAAPTASAPVAEPPSAPPAPPPVAATADAMLPKPLVPAVADPMAPPPGTPLPAPSAGWPAPSQGGATTGTAEGSPAAPVVPNVADLPAPAPPIQIANPALRDTATLVANGKDVVLYGIEGRSGEDATVLQNYIASAGGTLTCTPEQADRHVCMLPDGTDIAKIALVNGIASYALGGPQAYKDEEEDAQKARRGLWADLPPLPPEIDHPTMPNTAMIRAPSGDLYKLDGIEGVTGPMAATLQGYIAANGDSVQCEPQGPDSNVCVLRDATDIAKVALVNGLARVGADASTEYRIEQDAAKVNRRGIWANISNSDMSAAGQDMAQLRLIVANVDVYDDGLTIVDGQPTLLVDGAPVFMVFAGAAGWGYWDHGHSWHGAPERFSHRLDSLHPRGEGLRGWSNPRVREAMATARPGEFGRGAPVMRRGGPEGLRGGEFRGGEPMRGGEPFRGGARPEMRGPVPGGMRAPVSAPGMGGARPGMGGPAMGGMRPGGGGASLAAARPGMGAPAMGGMRPGMGAPAMGGMRPGAAMAPRPMPAAAPRPAPAPARPPHR